MHVSATAINATLSQWLRLLWDVAPPLHFDSEAPHIAGGAIHLPERNHWREHAAAAAHATAHLVYSPASFDGSGLVPIARTLMAVLEDARVEALAMRELPGLARLWLPLHSATPALGGGFEALLQRLARALADPAYDDPDPWVRKGRTLFYLDAGLGLLALRTPAEVRHAATLLGHDIGQMRLPFNARTHCPMPSYRDDHRWMWPADVLNAAPPPALAAGGASRDDEPPTVTDELVTRHPEWDHLISRVRLDWCRVVEQTTPPALPPAHVDEDAPGRESRRLQGPLRALAQPLGATRRSHEGDSFDMVALVDWRVARRLQHAPDARVYRGFERCRARAAVWLLVDQSASTAATHGTSGHSVLQTAGRSAAVIAEALQRLGVGCAIVGFSSQGRHAVRLVTVKEVEAPVDAAVRGRLQGLRPVGSTRLGAALRHATHRLTERHGGPRWVLVLSDGEPHDIDVHDPRYLVEDARHAVRRAARQAVQMACLVVGPSPGTEARRIFGGHRVQPLREVNQLPHALRRLLG
jgi:Mg-chelatase subunit ChlD